MKAKAKQGTKRLRSDRLTQLVAFALDNPDTWDYTHLAAWLAPPDQRRFRDEWGGVFAQPIPAELSADDKREIQRHARTLVEWTVAHHERGGPAFGDEADREFLEAVPLRKVNLRLHCFRDGRIGTVAAGRPVDCFALVAIQLLSSAPVGSLQRCAECSQVFVRVGRMVYCGRRCANRVNQRLWRKGEKGRAANRRSGKKVKTRARHGTRIVDPAAAAAVEPWSGRRKR